MEQLEKYCEQLKSAVDYINGVDMDEGLRKTIRRALMSELETKTDELEDEIRFERKGKPFSKQELSVLREELEGKIAKDWQEERAILDSLSIKLRRPNKAVKNKAISEGFVKAVDCWANRNDV